MRKIKFRLWDERRSEFEYWGNIEKGAFKGVPAINGAGIDENCSNSEQFTGLTDKNGVEIYEGDTLEIRYNNNKPSMIVDVEWIENMTGFSGKKREYDSTCCYISLNYSGDIVDGVYVIGNIQ